MLIQKSALLSQVSINNSCLSVQESSETRKMVASDDNSIITDACHMPGLMLSAYASLIVSPQQHCEVGLLPTFQR